MENIECRGGKSMRTDKENYYLNIAQVINHTPRGVILGVAGLGLVLLAWVIKLVQQKGE